MKYLSQYIEQEQSEAFKRAGAFFAFSDKQFDEQKNKKLNKSDYCNMYAGMICPKATAKALHKELDEIAKRGVEQDIKENGLTSIIKRELNNHEAYYTGNTESTENALIGLYPITKENIITVFKNQNATI